NDTEHLLQNLQAVNCAAPFRVRASLGNDDQARALAFAKLLKEQGMNTNHLATAFPHIGVNTILEVVIRDYVRTEKKKKGDHKGQM
ncbi:unnamed protein product, partial [Effrenium voratum]